MAVRLSRRSLVGLFGFSLLPGCVNVHSDSTENARTEDSKGDAGTEEQGAAIPEECEFPPQSLQGQADPIETTVERKRPDDLQAACATIAAEIALDQLVERLDLELTSQSHWISAGRQSIGDQQMAVIRVHAEKSTRESETSYHLCPDPKFDFDEAIQTVPEEVRVIIPGTDEKEELECATEVRLAQEQRHID